MDCNAVCNSNLERWGSPLVQEKYQEEKTCDKRQQEQQQQQQQQHNNNNNNNNKVSYLYTQIFNRLMTSYVESTGTYTETRDKQNQNRNKPWPKLQK